MSRGDDNRKFRIGPDGGHSGPLLFVSCGTGSGQLLSLVEVGGSGSSWGPDVMGIVVCEAVDDMARLD